MTTLLSNSTVAIMTTEQKFKSIKELFSCGLSFEIPMYQRNYAWGEKEIVQLISDIADCAELKITQSYYLGTLIVYPRQTGTEIIYEVVDGQQRLTTFLIMLIALIKGNVLQKNNNDVKNQLIEKVLKFRGLLHFAYRDGSTMAFDSIRNDPKRPTQPEENVAIRSAFKSMLERVKKACNDRKELTEKSFTEYLLDHVKILLIEVPQDTDLNHYFEIMNSRGEQLEQHEIVKANLMKPLQNDQSAMALFSSLWKAAANMSKYVIMGIEPSVRELMFGGDLKGLDFPSFDELSTRMKATENISGITLDELLQVKGSANPSKNIKDDQDADSPINAIVNFPNFLLLSLQLFVQSKKDSYQELAEFKMALDDKRLLDCFQRLMSCFTETKAAAFVKDFICALIRYRVLLDAFVLHPDESGWKLERVTQNIEGKKKKAYKVKTFNDDTKIIQLLSLFHVSSPTQNYKYWLLAVLNFINKHPDCSTTDYVEYLEGLAKAFALDRYLTDVPLDYETIIFEHDGRANNSVNEMEKVKEDKLRAGTAIENFLFNLYDYILCYDKTVNTAIEGEFRQSVKGSIGEQFVFTYRTSVEHFYPQNPVNNQFIDTKEVLHCFGNLCLISRNSNSLFSNDMPVAKVANYRKTANATASMKLLYMMSKTEKTKKWDSKMIQENHQEDLNRLRDWLSLH